MKLRLFFTQCFRSKEVRLSLVLFILLGVIGIFIGKRHLDAQKKAKNEVKVYQKEHLDRHVALHNDDLGLLLYYVKFAYVNPTNPIAGLSIGQSDINPSIKRLTIKTFEAQKHDSDLINPMNLKSGNLDFSFVLIYLIPLLVIVFNFNALSEETETGTWRLVAIQTKSKVGFILTKLLVRSFLILIVVVVLFILAQLILGLPITLAFWSMLLLAMLYMLFWFSVSFLIICLKKSSGFNALALLSVWLLLLILLPAGINAYVTTRFPVPEALSAAIAQRDGYHTKWDTEKRPTIEKFYAHYPQFKNYGYPTEGFNWLWYYAMQQMGDDDSKMERESLNQKIKQREEHSAQLSKWVPNMHLQLVFNKLAGTSLRQHISFLEGAEDFHERMRLFFYPYVFEEVLAENIDWNAFTPEYHKTKEISNPLFDVLPILLVTILVAIVSMPLAIKL